MSKIVKKAFVKIMAGILAALMIGSMCFTVVYYLITMNK